MREGGRESGKREETESVCVWENEIEREGERGGRERKRKREGQR